jgi:hypothetical protein
MSMAGSIVFLVFTAAVAAVYVAEISLLRKYIRRPGSKKRLLSKPALAIHLLALGGILCFIWGYFIEPYQLQVNRIDIFTRKLQDASLRIVQISDLHCDTKVRNEARLVDLVNGLGADIVVFTGDAINSPDALGTFKNTMRHLRANMAKLAVSGNWEHWHFKNLDISGDTDFRWFKNECLELTKDGQTFTVCGLGYPYYHKAASLLDGLKPDNYNIFLYHSPDLIEDIQGRDVDLYLCGHTHGGQVRLPLYGAMITFSKYGKKYESGKYQVGKTTLYVNRGVGMEGSFVPRVRFLCKPEIAVFDIKPEP